MTLQVLPPELLEQPKERIETKEPQPYWKPSSLKDGESKNSDYSAATKQDTQSWAGNTLVGRVVLIELRFSSYVVTRTHPGTPDDIARNRLVQTRPSQDRRELRQTRRFLAWVATSAARGRLEVLSLNKSLCVNS